MNLIQKLLPVECYSARSAGNQPRPLTRVRFIVQHFFSAIYVRPQAPYDLQFCWQLFRDMNFEPAQRLFDIYPGERFAASAHVLIARDGQAYELVPFGFQAWHAGESEWKGVKNLNSCSIGIENIGRLGDVYTDAQYRSNARICRHLMAQHSLSLDDIVGHEQVALPPGRKKDPGPTFDWNLLRRYITEAS